MDHVLTAARRPVNYCALSFASVQRLCQGIAGASGCGKSTVAQKLAQNMGSPFAPISLDNYLMPKWMPKAGGHRSVL